jgi:hypothetical protein
VTIDGRPVQTAVNDLLKAKPFLAKAEGGTGSGAPQNTPATVKNPWKKEQWNATEQLMLEKDNPELAAQLSASAGK